MRMKCDVIKDLMPSYIDNLLSEDSQGLVEEHLAECETCKAYYEALKGDDDIFEAAAEELHVDEIQPLKKIKKKMNRKTLIVSLISVLCAAVVGYGVFFALVHIDSYVPYEEAGITVSEDGKMYISEAFSGQVEYGYSDKHLKFFFVNDSFVTKNKKRSEDEAECYIQDFSRTEGTIRENVAGELVQTADYDDEVYYPSKEYAEKLQDRDFMVSMNAKEEDAFIKEMKAASVLLWRRPKMIAAETNATLSVRFTASVESLIEDKNLGTGEPRYAVVELFQGHPIVLDMGIKFGKSIKEGETYSFKMKDKFVQTSPENYSLEALISIYDLTLESVSAPTEEQIGLNSIDIQYTPF